MCCTRFYALHSLAAGYSILCSEVLKVGICPDYFCQGQRAAVITRSALEGDELAVTVTEASGAAIPASESLVTMARYSRATSGSSAGPPCDGAAMAGLRSYFQP